MMILRALLYVILIVALLVISNILPWKHGE